MIDRRAMTGFVRRPRSDAAPLAARLRRRVSSVRRGGGPTPSRWPNLFVVGAPKAGTTSLWHYLNQHPQIYMSSIKEPNFFSAVDPKVFRTIGGEREYLGLFAGATTEKLLGEATPSYLGDPGAPAAIARVSPDARIVMILRDPISRAYSAYWDSARGLERRTFAEAVAGELSGDTSSSYIHGSLYAEGVERYVRTFERVLVLFFEEFTRDVRGTVRQVYEFLTVDPSAVDRLRPIAHNPFSVPRNVVARRVLRSRVARRVGRVVVPFRFQISVEAMFLRPAAKPVMEPEARAMLAETFSRDADRLERLLGRPVPWRD